jgi:hypothetical protein
LKLRYKDNIYFSIYYRYIEKDHADRER